VADSFSEIILMGDTRVSSVPVIESRDVLTDLETDQIMPFDDRKRVTNGSLSMVRGQVARRLAEASSRLPNGISLLGIEAYRPPALQQSYFDSYWRRLRSEHPVASDDELWILASRYVSPPTIAPHPSGAAIDLTLIDDAVIELDMGTAVDATPEGSRLACYTKATNVSVDARANRRLLASVLEPAGFVNYPTEWWHWSYGDRYWALRSGAPNALYGPTIPDR
jgi:D-alanyl-D-alanine dipeptidase